VPDHDDLKAFGAAFATVSSAPMFHIVGITPDAPDLEQAISQDQTIERCALGARDLADSWIALNKAEGESVDFISLGNPHFSVSEFARLADLCANKTKLDGMDMVITSSRDVVNKASEAGYIAILEAFGAKIITDTCWCMIGEPVITESARVILTNSAKYAHYGPGITGRSFKLANLETCVSAAISGKAPNTKPDWMSACCPA
jgi:predicted aconitase